MRLPYIAQQWTGQLVADERPRVGATETTLTSNGALMNLRHALVIPCLLALSPQVHAIDLIRPLGYIDSPESIDIRAVHRVNRPFEDWFVFFVAPGSELTFSGQLRAGAGREFAREFDASLYRYGTEVVDGWDHAGSGGSTAPSRLVDFAPVTLRAGLYTLVVEGLLGSPFNLTRASYSGSLNFALAAPVPEPAAGLLLAAGLIAVALGRRRRNASSEADASTP